MRADLQTSEEWLKSHSIEHMKLTLKDLVDKGKVSGYTLNLIILNLNSVLLMLFMRIVLSR